MSIAFIDLAAQQRRIRPAIDAAIAKVMDHGGYVMGPEVRALEADLAAFGQTEFFHYAAYAVVFGTVRAERARSSRQD